MPLLNPLLNFGAFQGEMGKMPTDRFVTRHYGVRADGVADDSVALQEAADAVPDNRGGIVELPPGNVLLKSPVAFKPKTILMGHGRATDVICQASAADTAWLKNALAATGADGTITLRDFNLTLQNGSLYAGQTGIELKDRSGGGTEHASYCLVENVQFNSWNWRALYMDKATISHVDRCQFSEIKNVMYATKAGAAWPIYIDTDGNGVSIRRSHISACDGAIKVAANAAALTISECVAEGGGANYANPGIGEMFFFSGVTSLNFLHNYVEGFATGTTDFVLRLAGCKSANIRGNYMQGLSGASTVSYGLILVGTSKKVIVEGNDLENPSTRYITASSSPDTIVCGNRYVIGGAEKTTPADIRANIGGDMIWCDNEFVQVKSGSPVTPDAMAGKYINLELAGGAHTINAPTNPPATADMPRELIFLLRQDGTGGYAVIWNSIYVSNYSDTGNTANKRCTVTFAYDGTNWVGQATGWYA